MKLHSNIPLSERACRTHDSATDSRWRSYLKVMGFTHQFSAHSIFLKPFERFSLNYSNIPLWDGVQNPWLFLADLRSSSQFKVMGPNHQSVSAQYLLNWKIFIKFHSNVPLSERCRTHDWAMQTQGHGIYPSLFSPFHISWTLWSIYIKLYSNVPLNKMVWEPMTQLCRLDIM